MKISNCLICALVLANVPLAIADTAYIVDELLVGIHQEQNLDSAIIKVVTTGTKLEVSERDGELAKVIDETGAEGWVDAAYLTSELPARVRVDELKAQVVALEKALQQQPDGDAQTKLKNEMDTLERENTELKTKLSAERVTIGKLNAELGAARAQNANSNSESGGLAPLIEERDALRRELNESQQTLAQLHRQAGGEALPAITGAAPPSNRIFYSVAAATALLGFGLGAWLIDYLARRRHGGVRL
ncbi:MAG: TIGR04211 family SH3 domain-containing protein [Pseudomonadota bacterium]